MMINQSGTVFVNALSLKFNNLINKHSVLCKHCCTDDNYNTPLERVTREQITKNGTRQIKTPETTNTTVFNLKGMIGPKVYVCLTK